MFLVALTTRSLADAFDDFSVHEFATGTMKLTTVVDDRLSACIVDPDRVTVLESPTLENVSHHEVVPSRAVYQKQAGTFEISRPTASGRPLYTHLTEQGEFFCSTHLSLLRKAGVSIRENTAALPEFFAYRHVMPPRTIYLGIQQIGFGGHLQLQVKNNRCVILKTQAYDPPMPRTNAEQPKAADVFERTHELLETATTQFGRNADELALLLSGGLDSSILYKICRAKYDLRTTYSSGYPFEPEEHNWEKNYAMSAAKSFGISHTYFQPNVNDFLHGLIDAVAIAEEPLKHIQSVLLYRLFKDGIPKDRRIVICGQGAGGVLDPIKQLMIFKRDTTLFRALSKQPIFNTLKMLSRLTGRGRYWIGELDNIRRSRLPIDDKRHIVWDMESYCDSKWINRYFGLNYDDFAEHQRTQLRAFADRSYYDISTVFGLYGQDSVTTLQWSKLAESQGKLLHCPLLDSNVLNYAFTLPWPTKLAGSKYIMRGVARRLNIPEEIITRPKSCFGIRRTDWALRGGPFEPLIPLAAKVIDEAEIRSMQSEKPQSAMTFWKLLNYGIWKRICIDEEPVSKLQEELKEQLAREKVH